MCVQKCFVAQVTLFRTEGNVYAGKIWRKNDVLFPCLNQIVKWLLKYPDFLFQLKIDRKCFEWLLNFPDFFLFWLKIDSKGKLL